MWIGERITENGIGNGISLLIMAGIVSNMFNWGRQAAVGMVAGTVHPIAVIVIVLALLAMIVAITFVDMGERRIPIQYAKRVVGRKMYGGQATYLPMKVNMSGVLPIIFAQSIASLPPTIILLCGGSQDSWFMRTFDSNTIPYAIVYFLLILFFAYFYATIQFNPVEVANNLKKNGGFIPGYPSRQADQRVHSEGPEQGHPVRRRLSRHHRLRAHHHQRLLQGRCRYGHLPRRHLDHHCGRRCHRNGAGSRKPDAHAPLQGFP